MIRGGSYSALGGGRGQTWSDSRNLRNTSIKARPRFEHGVEAAWILCGAATVYIPENTDLGRTVITLPTSLLVHWTRITCQSYVSYLSGRSFVMNSTVHFRALRFPPPINSSGGAVCRCLTSNCKQTSSDSLTWTYCATAWPTHMLRTKLLHSTVGALTNASWQNSE